MYADEGKVQTLEMFEYMAWLAVWTYISQVSYWWIKMK
jgi:hypothetical protein